jgi:hypothetical protein
MCCRGGGYAVPVMFSLQLATASAENAGNVFEFDLEVIGGSRHGHLLSYDLVTQYADPVYAPRVLPPLPWLSPLRGCYDLACRRESTFRVSVARTKSPAQRNVLLEAHQSAADGSQQHLADLRQLGAHSVGCPANDGESAVAAADLHGTPLPPGTPDIHGTADNDVATAILSDKQGLSSIYDALSFLGSRPWCINKRVLEVCCARELVLRGSDPLQ